MKCFIACDRNGYPLGRIKAESKERAAAIGDRRIVGYFNALEVKSMAPSDIENCLYESFKQMGMSDSYARIAATQTNVTNLRTYEDHGASGESTHKRQADQFVSRYARPEQSLFESFRRLGLDDDHARTAAEGRR